MQINMKQMYDDAKFPTRGSEEAAGWDLYAHLNEPIVIDPDSTVLVNTGIAMEIPDGFFGALYARSGLALKQGIALANGVGVIDSDYRNEIKVALHNYSDRPQIINPNERISQIVVQPYLTIVVNPVDELNNTQRDLNGFGSTGKN